MLRKPLLVTSFVMLLEELPPSGSVVLDFVDLRGIFARNCLIMVETVEFVANDKPGFSGTKMDMGFQERVRLKKKT